MPLQKSSSKPAFVSNLKAEIAAGKPQKQALAIAYSVKRMAKRARGGMADGGDPGESYDPSNPTNDFAQTPLRPWPVSGATPQELENIKGATMGHLGVPSSASDPRFAAANAILQDRPASDYPTLHHAVHGLFGDTGGMSPYDMSAVTPAIHAKEAYDAGDYPGMIAPAAGMAAGIGAGALTRALPPKLAAAGIGAASAAFSPTPAGAGEDAFTQAEQEEIKAIQDNVGPEPVKPSAPDLANLDTRGKRSAAKQQYETDLKGYNDRLNAWNGRKDAATAKVQDVTDKYGSKRESAASESVGGENWMKKLWDQPIAKTFPPAAFALPLAGGYAAYRSPYKLQQSITNTYNERVAEAEAKLAAANKVMSGNPSTQAQISAAKNKAYPLVQDAKGIVQDLPPTYPGWRSLGLAAKGPVISYLPQEMDYMRLGTTAHDEAEKSFKDLQRLGFIGGLDTALGLGATAMARKGIAPSPAGRLEAAQETYNTKYPLPPPPAKPRSRKKSTSAAPPTEGDTGSAGVSAEDRPWLLPGWNETRSQGGALSTPKRAAGGAARSYTAPSPSPALSAARSARTAMRAAGGSIPSGNPATVQSQSPRSHTEAQKRATGGSSCDSSGQMGQVRGYAPGGIAAPQMPWFARQEARNMTHSGPIVSAVPGRTDRLNMNVKSGSYVLPAETVSHLGQSNSIAGLKVAGHMFGGGHNSMPKPPPMMKFAQGGATGDHKVPIVAAGGEFVIDPAQVAKIGGGDVDRGHRILDAFVLHMRKKHIDTLRHLKPPAKD